MNIVHAWSLRRIAHHLAVAAMLLCLPLLAGCPKEPVRPVDLPPATFADRWQAYTALNQNPVEDIQAFRIRATLQYETPSNQGHRMTSVFWGNSDLPVRLDIFAGVGVMVAQIREDKRHFLLHMNEQQAAYAHQGANKPYINIGTPLPFTLERLADLLCGRFGDVFGYSAKQMDESGTQFVLDESAPVQGVLRLSEQGHVEYWSGSPPSGRPGGVGYGWVMDLDYAQDTPHLPRRITMRHEGGYSAMILVKSRDFPEPYTPDRLALDLPPQVNIQELRAPERQF